MLAARGMVATIPSTTLRKPGIWYDPAQYVVRHLVENYCPQALGNRGRERRSEMVELIEELTAFDGVQADEIGGDRSCVYCSAFLEYGGEHERSCPRERALKLLAELKR